MHVSRTLLWIIGVCLAVMIVLGAAVYIDRPAQTFAGPGPTNTPTPPPPTPTPTPTPPPGGSINGTVTEEGTGTPLQDICVYATEDGGASYGYDTTDALGAYSIGALAGGDYRVEFYDCVSPATYVLEWYDDQPDYGSADLVTVTAGSKTADVDAALALGGSINGTVTKEGTGGPLEGICVSASQDGGPGYGFGQTDVNGEYSIGGLAGGDYRVDFYDCSEPVTYVREWYDDQPDYSSADLVSVILGAKTAGIDAALVTGGSINGTVTEDGSGTPLQDICVSASEDGAPGYGSGQTDASGNYTIGGLPGGDYSVYFYDCSSPVDYAPEYYDDQPDFNSADLVAVTLGSKTAGIDAALNIGGSVNGTVTEEGSGTPLQGICVQVEEDGGPGYGFGFTDASGNYTASALPGGNYRVRFYDCSPPYQHVSEYYDDQPFFSSADLVAVTKGSKVSGIDAELEVAGSINGTVTAEATGAPMSGICVSASQDGGPGGGGDSTDSSGNYTVEGLAGGDYRVYFYDCSSPVNYVPEYYDDQPDGGSADLVPVSSGIKTSGIDAELVVGGSINGAVVDESTGAPLAGACISVSEDGGPGYGFYYTDASGDYSIGALPSGNYRVYFYDCAPPYQYVGEYYDDESSYGSADLVAVTLGAKTGDIDAALAQADTDGDGCSDIRESLPKSQASQGGGRDYQNPYDFYDVYGPNYGPPDRIVDLPNDILGVILHYSPVGQPPYNAFYDRGPSAGPNPWNMTAPDGVIDLANDILGVILQYLHDCR